MKILVVLLMFLYSITSFAGAGDECASVAKLADTIVQAKQSGKTKKELTAIVKNFKDDSVYGGIARETGLYIIKYIFGNSNVSKDDAVNKAFVYCNSNLK